MISLENQTVFVTGASRGAGAGIARQIAEAGGRVILGYARNTEAAKAMASELGDKAIGLVKADFSDPAAAVIGKRYGKHRFDNGRSVEGTLTFVLVGTLVATATMAIFHGDVALWRALVIAFVASTAGGLTELFSTRLDDNLGIPVSAGLAAWGTWFLTGLV